jgi:hypothetical protein
MALNLHGISWFDAHDLMPSFDDGAANGLVMRVGASCVCGDGSSSSGGGDACNAAAEVDTFLCHAADAAACPRDESSASRLEPYEWLAAEGEAGFGSRAGRQVYPITLACANSSGGAQEEAVAGGAAEPTIKEGGGGGAESPQRWRLVWAGRAALAACVGFACSNLAARARTRTV